MRGKILFVFVFLLLVIPLVQGQLIYRQNNIVDLQITCEFNGTYCSSSAACNITSNYPNGTTFIDNQLMTQGQPNHNYTLNTDLSSEIGTYNAIVLCTDQGFASTSTFDYDITPTGSNLTTAQSIVYLITLFISLVLFIIVLIGAIRMPYQNQRNEDGAVILIEEKKYMKLFLWFLTYIFLVWTSFLSWSITYGFLNFGVAASIFRTMFLFLLYMFIPVFLTFVFISFRNMIYDKRIQRAIERGFPI